MIQLVRAELVHGGGQRLGTQQVPFVDRDPVTQMLGVAEPLARSGADEPGDLVTPLEQQLGQKRAVLAREAGDERDTPSLSLIRHGRRYGGDGVASERARPSCARGGSIPLLSNW